MGIGRANQFYLVQFSIFWDWGVCRTIKLFQNKKDFFKATDQLKQQIIILGT